MKRHLIACAFAMVACAKPAEVAPELVKRGLPTQPDGTPIQAAPGGETFFDPDAGSTILDTGCCTVSFALVAHPGEVAASLLFQSERFDMANDGGIWQVNACVELSHNVYSYQTGYTSDDPQSDAGLVWVDRVNDAVPEDFTSSVASVVDVFDVPDAAVCGMVDLGIHGRVPARNADAGDLASGVDAGTDAGTGDVDLFDGGPTETTIPGACDTLSAPSILMGDGTGTVVIDDALSAVTALPFSFQFYGAPMTHFVASSNGYLQLFTSARGSATQDLGEPIPSAAAPNGVVAPLWCDLVNVPESYVQSQVFGTAGSRHLTVEWKNWTFLTTGVERVTFQAKFFETSNAIEFHYCTLNANGGMTTYEAGFSASVGIESPNGLHGVQHSYQVPSLTTSNAIHYQ